MLNERKIRLANSTQEKRRGNGAAILDTGGSREYARGVKILRLGNSNDTGAWVPEGDRRHVLVQERLAEELGEPVETFVKAAWPNRDLPAAVARWMDEFEPDLVYFKINSFAYQYESVPLKLQRKFGRAGELFGNAGLGAAERPWLSHNAAFRAARRLAQRSIGGVPHVEPEEAAAAVEATIRAIIRHEGTALLVKGHRGRSKEPDLTPAMLARAEARRLLVHEHVSRVCAELKVDYLGNAQPAWLTDPKPRRSRVGDDLHHDAAGHRDGAAEEAEMLLATWRRHTREDTGATADARP